MIRSVCVWKYYNCLQLYGNITIVFYLNKYIYLCVYFFLIFEVLNHLDRSVLVKE